MIDFYAAVAGLATIVLVLPGVVERRREQLLDDARPGRSRPVMSSAGALCALDVAVKNRLAEAKPLCLETDASMTQPSWSAAR